VPFSVGSGDWVWLEINTGGIVVDNVVGTVLEYGKRAE